MELTCAVNLQKKLVQQKKLTTEHGSVKQNLQDLKPPPLNTKDLIKAYPDRFEGIGRFPGTYHITLHSDVKPVTDAPWKCPIAMWPLMWEKLDEFMEQGIIIPVEEPMDWVSSLTYSWRANGKLRVCLDPWDVNKAIKRDHYKTPTVEEITHLLAGSKKFTKVNGTSSYLCIVLDYESPLLTTFNTPWGRYRFIRLPWGLSCAQDIFQWMMDQILECCEGVIGIADDIIIHGKDEDHDRNLHNFMHTACEHGLVFNGEKCEVKKDSVTFFGTVHYANGAHPDLKKVDAVHKMPPPDNKQQLQHFPGNGYISLTFYPITLYTHCTSNCWKRTQGSCGILHTRKPSTRSRNWSARTPHSGTLMFGNPSLSKLMHQRRDLELHSCKKDTQLPLLPKLLPLQSNDKPT